jgi:hypothetical protein
MRLRGTALTTWFMVLSVVSPAAWADFGRFFPDGTKILDGITFADAAPSKFDKDAVDGAKTVGNIKFDYDPYLESADPKTAAGGGGALSGGFYIDPKLQVAPGETLAWVQTLIATLTTDEGTNLFKLPDTNAGRYPDATPTNRTPDKNNVSDLLFAPSYKFNRAALDPPNGVPAPTLGFQDFPALTFNDNPNLDRSFVAQLGLACFDNKPGKDGVTQVHIIESFLWGFSVAANAKTITPNAPSFWGPPTQGYMDTLNAFYNTGTSPAPGKVATDKYNFTVDQGSCFVAVPEPSTLILVAIGALSCMTFLRIGRKDGN